MSIPELYLSFLASEGICTDSRKIVTGSIFFALKGAHFNGNEHAISAIEQGCSYAVVDEDLSENNRSIRVENVLETLQALALHHRKQVAPYVIGITGSNGKTTTKELLLAVLSRSKRTHATVGNFNNHFGVPLSLLAMPLNTEIAIIEMGANHIGEIADLCMICDPDLGVVTNIGRAHLEGFGSIEGVIEAKGELYDHIRKKNGELLVCSDDELLMDMSIGITRTTYGIKSTADVSGVCKKEIPFLQLDWKTQVEESVHHINTQLSGMHNLQNLLCAICAGVKVRIPPNEINEALREHVPSNNRSEWVKTKNNEILLDAYNANPSSMEVAIKNFSKLQDIDQLLILGDMKELGEFSEQEHRKIVELTSELKIQAIFVGPEFEKVILGQTHFVKTEALIEMLKELPVLGKQILIKGSRSIALEKVVEEL